VASNDLLAWGSLVVAGLTTAFIGLQALKTVAVTELVTCPNCAQSFDAKKFHVVLGKRKITCPRCWYTWE